MTDNDDWIAEDAIEDWISDSGIRCVIRAGFMCICGYVRLPDSLVGVWKSYHDADEALACTVELTFGPQVPDEFNQNTGNQHWLGFDTGHYMDYWAPDDLIGRVSEEGFRLARTMAEIDSLWSGGEREREQPRWTMDKLRAKVTELADQVAVLASSSDVINSLKER